MRRAAIVVAALGLAGGRAGADEPAGAPRAFVEWVAEPSRAWVGQAVLLRLRVGIDAVWFDEHAVPPSLRATDVPVAVRAPGWDAAPGAVRLSDPPRAAGGAHPTVALGDAVVEGNAAGTVVREGRTFVVVEVARRVAASKPGLLRLEAPSLRYVHASAFREDLLGNRVPVDAREAVVEGAPLEVRVEALPEEGRPAGSSGAVGRFRISARAGEQEVRAGEPFTVVVTVEGEGNLETAEPPRPSLHVLGTVDDHASPVRTVRHDVAIADAGPASVPAIEWPYFDPGPPSGWRVARSEPIPVTVLPAAPAQAPPPRPPRPASPPPSIGDWVWIVLGSALVLAAALAAAARGRRRPREAPVLAGPTRASKALAALREAPDEGLADAFAEVVAARLGTPAAAAIAPDLEARLVAAGVEPGAAARVARALEALVASRYGGSAPAPSREELLALAGAVSR